MRLFRSEGHVDRWCAFRGVARGATMPPERCWRLALAWYGDRLAPGWRTKTAEEAEAALAGAGLTGPFWRLRP